MSSEFPELNPPLRILMGPGPSSVHPRVLRAMGTPLVGHLDPAFLEVMDQTMSLLRYCFQTENRFTIPVSGTGSAGMEAAFANLLEPGEVAVIGVNGVFGERMCDVASRCGAEVVRVEAEWGRIIEPDQFERALAGRQAKLVALVHAETSTGVEQPVEPVAQIAHRHGALVVADTVTSLGGVQVQVDGWGVDCCYSGTQKCLSVPPGLAPLTFNESAMEALHRRKHKVQSWYLDMAMIERYWGGERLYHHTAPVSMIYGLREGLRIIHQEGLEARWRRHRLNGQALHFGLEAMGLSLQAQQGYRLPTLTTVGIPSGVDDLAVRRSMLEEFGIEIGGGLGAFKGKAWRIGLMGESSTQDNVLLALSALERLLTRQGVGIEPAAGVRAAVQALEGG